MRSIVLIKQVPEMERVVFDREKGVIDRTSAGTQINPFDLNALEAAFEIRRQCGGTVTALSMGPESAKEALREALARGCDEAWLASDKRFGGSDVRATATVLAAAIRKTGPFDLVLAGMQTVDGDTGQVGPEVAEFLEIPHACYAEEIAEITGAHIQIKSGLWDGQYLVRLAFPALITVTKDISRPQLPLLVRKLAARQMPIGELTAEALSLEEGEIGFSGSPTKVRRIEVEESVQREGIKFARPTGEAIDKVREVLYGR